MRLGLVLWSIVLVGCTLVEETHSFIGWDGLVSLLELFLSAAVKTETCFVSCTLVRGDSFF